MFFFLKGLQTNRMSFTVLGIVFLTLTALTRQEFILVAITTLCIYLIMLRKQIHQIILSTLIFIISFVSLNFIVIYNIKDYKEGIYSTNLIMLFDLVAMSLYKDELLVPLELYKPVFQNPAETLQKMKDIGKDRLISSWVVFQDEFSLLLVGETNKDSLPKSVWNPRLTLKQALPIYFKNIPSYIWHRMRVTYKYIKQLKPLHFLFLLFTLVTLFFIPNKRFILITLFTSFTYMIIISKTCIVTQMRYMMPSITLWYLSFLYSLIYYYNKITVKMQK